MIYVYAYSISSAVPAAKPPHMKIGEPSYEVFLNRRHRFLILLCVSVPSFMLSLDANIVAVSLPSIAQSLGATFASIEWVISAYMLTFASLVLPAGMLADRFGRKKALLGGLGLFTLASLLCGAASSVGTLNISRAAQGVGAALMLSAALATLSQEFQGRERAQAFAFWGSVIGIAITIGPVAGGIITQALGWEWTFYINVPVGLAMMGLTLDAVRDSRDPNSKSVDFAGAFLYASALSIVTLALISGNHAGWTNRGIAIEFGLAGLLFLGFIVVELKQSRPMLDLTFFRRPTYIGANIAGLVYAAALLTMLTYLPLYFQGGLSLSPREAGLRMLPMALPVVLVPRLTARYLTHRLSGRAILTLGLALVAFGLLWMALIAGSFHYNLMLVGMLVAGLGAGLLNGETAKVGMTVIPPERAGMAAGVGGTIRFTGVVIGFAALGAVLYGEIDATLKRLLPNLDSHVGSAIVGYTVAGDFRHVRQMSDGLYAATHEAFGAGYQAVFLTAAILASLAGVSTWLLVRSSDTEPVSRLNETERNAEVIAIE